MTDHIQNTALPKLKTLVEPNERDKKIRGIIWEGLKNNGWKTVYTMHSLAQDCLMCLYNSNAETTEEKGYNDEIHEILSDVLSEIDCTIDEYCAKGEFDEMTPGYYALYLCAQRVSMLTNNFALGIFLDLFDDDNGLFKKDV